MDMSPQNSTRRSPCFGRWHPPGPSARPYQDHLSPLTASPPPPIIYHPQADLYGVFGSAFCDFGRGFTVLDTDGEEPHSGIVAGITPGTSTLVTTIEDERLEFQDGGLPRL